MREINGVYLWDANLNGIWDAFNNLTDYGYFFKTNIDNLWRSKKMLGTYVLRWTFLVERVKNFWCYNTDGTTTLNTEIVEEILLPNNIRNLIRSSFSLKKSTILLLMVKGL